MHEQPVTKEEFDAFLKNYPRELSRHVVTYVEPPVLTYNDYSLGKFPDSIVAWYVTEPESNWHVRRLH